MHDANTDLVRELRVPSNADDEAIQEALKRLFDAQGQVHSDSIAVEGQAVRAQGSVSKSGQALKAKSQIKFSSVQK